MGKTLAPRESTFSRESSVLSYKHQTDSFVKLKSSPFAIVGVNYQSVSGKYKSNRNVNTNIDMIVKDLQEQLVPN